MKKTKGTAIKSKLLISYFAFVFILIIVGIAGIYNLRKVYKNGSEIYKDSLMAVEYMTEIDRNVKEIDRCILGMLSDFDTDYHEIYLKRISNSMSIIADAMKNYEALENSGIEGEVYRECKENIECFDNKYIEIISVIDEGKRDEAIKKCENELAVVKDTAYKSIGKMIRIEEERASKIEADNKDIYNKIIWLFSFIAIAGVFAAVGIAAYIGNYFSSRLNSIQLFARRLSEYNVAEDIKDTKYDEFGKTIKILNESQFMIRGFMGKVIAEAKELSETGNDVSNAVRKAEERTEEVNLEILEASQKAKYIDESINSLLGDRTLDENVLQLLETMSGESADICIGLQHTETELTGITTYLEQIAITTDYQNDIANYHREQVEKFKVDKEQQDNKNNG